MSGVSADGQWRAGSRIGTILHGKYRLDRVLGVGGMAVVYASTHRNQKQFAIKILHAELSTRIDIRTRFLREGYAANSVKHAGAVAVLDDDVAEDGSAFLVMELLDGATVAALVQNRRTKCLTAREVLELAYQLLDVLDAAHAKGIIHRDVKPANLFVLQDGLLRVLDFGIARVRDETASLLHVTMPGLLLGTPAFMAPEQAAGQGSDVDARTDLWGVGATLFTLLSGQLVHQGASAHQLLVRLATVPAPSLTTVVPETPLDLAGLVAKALAIDKAERWQSAAAMREAVVQVHRRLFGEAPGGPALKGLFGQPGDAEIRSPQGTTLAPSEKLELRQAPFPATLAARSGTTSTTSRPVGTQVSATARSHRPRIATLAAAGLLAMTGAAITMQLRQPTPRRSAAFDHAVADSFSSVSNSPQPTTRMGHEGASGTPIPGESPATGSAAPNAGASSPAFIASAISQTTRLSPSSAASALRPFSVGGSPTAQPPVIVKPAASAARRLTPRPSASGSVSPDDLLANPN